MVGGAVAGASAQSTDGGRMSLKGTEGMSIVTVDGGKTWQAVVSMRNADGAAANKISAGHQGAEVASAGHTAVFPNPTAGAFSILYRVEQPGEVDVTLHDLHGSEVLRAFEGPRATGEHTLQMDAASLPGGVYFYRVHNSGTITAGSTVVVTR